MNLLYVQLFNFAFVDPATDLPMASGWVSVKLAGTNTNATTYTTAVGTSNANPTQLNAAGRGTFYFDPVNAGTSGQMYDVFVYAAADTGLTTPILTFEDVSVPVAAATGNATSLVLGFGSATTLTIAGGAITPTKNEHHVSPESGAADNLDTMAVSGLPDGALLIISNTNGAAPITIRSGVDNILTSDGNSIVLSTVNQRQSFIRDGANWYAVGPSTAPVLMNDVADGRLTITSGVPVVSSSFGSTLYYTPFRGNRMSLYSGSIWQILTFSELSLAVNTLTNDKPADIWAYNNGGVVALDFTVWTNATTRATALTIQDGVIVKSGATTRRYLGTVYPVTGQILDTPANRNCWNYNNRVVRPILIQETGSATSSYNTATWRQANGNAANQVTVMVGIGEDALHLHASALIGTGTAGDRAYVGISTQAASPFTPIGSCLGVSSTSAPAAGFVTAESDFTGIVSPAFWTFVWAERGSASGTLTWYYAISVDNLIVSGLSGTVMG
jgi:hypothetical protein